MVRPMPLVAFALLASAGLALALGGAEPAKDAASASTTHEAPDGTPLPVVCTSEVGVKVLIEDLRLGEGEECKPGASVTVLYHGTLTDGTVFDSTRQRNNEPSTFALDNLIEGWKLGIPGMKVGGVRRLTIPYQLAYGPKGRPPTIPAKADLIFSLELKGVENPK